MRFGGGDHYVLNDVCRHPEGNPCLQRVDLLGGALNETSLLGLNEQPKHAKGRNVEADGRSPRPPLVDKQDRFGRLDRERDGFGLSCVESKEKRADRGAIRWLTDGCARYLARIDGGRARDSNAQLVGHGARDQARPMNGRQRPGDGDEGAGGCIGQHRRRERGRAGSDAGAGGFDPQDDLVPGGFDDLCRGSGARGSDARGPGLRARTSGAAGR